MKHGFKLIIMLMMLSTPCFGQTQLKGIQEKGITPDNRDALKRIGLVAEWQADQGLLFSSSSNVSSWTDLTGNNWVLRSASTTNAPFFSPSFSTNLFPAVIFKNAPRIMTEHSLGGFLNGKAQLTVIQLVNAQTNQNSCYSLTIGNTGSTNQSFSSFGILPCGSAVTNYLIRSSTDNGNSTLTIATPFQINSNLYNYVGFIYSNGNTRGFNNLALGSFGANGVNRTLNTFTLNALTGSNGVVNVHGFNAITGTWVFTNALSSTVFSNTINSLNAQRRAF